MEDTATTQVKDDHHDMLQTTDDSYKNLQHGFCVAQTLQYGFHVTQNTIFFIMPDTYKAVTEEYLPQNA